VKNTLLSGAIAALLAGPAMAQTASLDDIQKEIAEMKVKNERLEAEVEYLKENAKGQRKEAAVEAVDVSNLKTTASKFVWSGDFRFRDEEITQAANNTADEHTRSRQRARLRFGVLVKVNDTINAKIQLSTTNSGNDNARSTNQTLGNGTAGNGPWDRKLLGIDQAYVDWKATSFMNLQLGKTPIPWTTTASYFWDKDLTPEGIALKFSKGIFFGGVYYDWLNERHAGFADSNSAGNADAKLISAQGGVKLPIGKTTLTAAAGYFDLRNVKDRSIAANTGAGTTCAADNAFNGATNGNGTYTGPGTNIGDAANTCTRLLSDFNLINALVQLDFTVGKYPMNTFVDYMKNNAALPLVNGNVGKVLDDALAIGVTFNKASAPKSWETSLVYEKNGKDAIFGQFVDSDFAGGNTDGKGWVIKGSYVPAANWTIAGTYFINKLSYDGVAANSTARELTYKRLQLDLNYKF
jgi:Putative porin